MNRIAPIILIAIAQLCSFTASAQEEQKLELYLETGHTGDIFSTFFSLDDRTITSVSLDDDTMKLWDAASGQELNTVKGFNAFSISSDMKTVALQAWEGKTITLWDLASWRKLYTLSTDSAYGTIAFSPDGKKIVWWNYTTVMVWDVSSGRELYTLRAQTDSNSQAFFSPDCNTVAWRTNGQIRLFNAASGHELHTLNTGNLYTNVLFSPDGQKIASWDYTTIRLWDVNSGQELNSLKGLDIVIFNFSPDGHTLALAYKFGSDITISLWDVAQGQKLRTLKEHLSSFSLVSFSPDGKTIMVLDSSWKIVTCIDVTSGQELHILKDLNSGNLAFSPTWRNAVSWVGGGNTIKLWETGQWQELGTLKVDYSVSGVSFSMNGRMIFSWNDNGNAVTYWDVESRRKLYDFRGPFARYRPLTSSSGAKTTMTLMGDKIALWDLKLGRLLQTINLKGNAFPVKLFSLSPDGKALVTWDSTIKGLKLWDLATGQPPRNLLLNENTSPQHHARTSNTSAFITVKLSAIFSPDSKTIAVLLPGDKTVTLWNVASGKRLHTSYRHTEYVTSAVFSPDGKKIALAGGNVITLFDALSGVPLRTFKGFVERSLIVAPVNNLIFSPNGEIIASFGVDPKVHMWDIASGRELHTFEGHGEGINAIAFDPYSRTIASASWDHTIKLWDVTSGQIVRTLVGHDESVNSVAFSADGKIIASASLDGTTKLWDTGSGRVLKTLQSDDPKTPSEVFSLVPDFYTNSRSAPISPDGKLQAKLAENGRVNLLDVKTGTVMAGLIALGDEEWIVATPEGRFDTNKSLDQIEGLHWVINEEILKPLPLDVFMRQYYEPGLLRRALNGEQFKALPSIASINRVQPKVAIKKIRAANGADLIDVTVEVGNVTEDVSLSATDRTKKRRLSSGVFDVRLFRDGQLVGHSTTDEKLQNTFRTYKDFDEESVAWREANKVEIVNGKKTLTFRVKLPNNPNNKQVEFSAYAFNADRVKSRTARMTYTVPTNANRKPEPRVAYIITFGVNKYDNSEWDLHFAGNDARAMSKIVSAKLRQRKEFVEVVEIPLISDSQFVNNNRIEKRDATKGNVQTILELLAGKTPPANRLKNLEKAAGAETLHKIHKAKPDDMALISFASHGYVNQSGIFYIIPTDIGTDSGKRVTDKLLSRSISSDELSLWLRDVDAGEMVMIIDSCHAASAVEGTEFKPGPMGSRGLGQLAFDKGIRILAATQAAGPAWEMGGSVRQGLLSYALLEEGLAKRRANFKLPDDGRITLHEWLEFGVEEVPNLYLRFARGESITAGRDAIMDENIQYRGYQRPSLFDFSRRRADLVLMEVQ